MQRKEFQPYEPSVMRSAFITEKNQEELDRLNMIVDFVNGIMKLNDDDQSYIENTSMWYLHKPNADLIGCYGICFWIKQGKKSRNIGKIKFTKESIFINEGFKVSYEKAKTTFDDNPLIKDIKFFVESNQKTEKKKGK